MNGPQSQPVGNIQAREEFGYAKVYCGSGYMLGPSIVVDPWGEWEWECHMYKALG